MYTGTAAAKKSIRTDISLDLCAQCPASTTRSMPGEGRIRGLEFRVEGFRGLGLRAQGKGPWAANAAIVRRLIRNPVNQYRIRLRN